jgi:hypothetical protein
LIYLLPAAGQFNLIKILIFDNLLFLNFVWFLFLSRDQFSFLWAISLLLSQTKGSFQSYPRIVHCSVQFFKIHSFLNVEKEQRSFFWDKLLPIFGITFARFVGTSFRTPFDIVKQRMQVQCLSLIFSFSFSFSLFHFLDSIVWFCCGISIWVTPQNALNNVPLPFLFTHSHQKFTCSGLVTFHSAIMKFEFSIFVHEYFLGCPIFNSLHTFKEQNTKHKRQNTTCTLLNYESFVFGFFWMKFVFVVKGSRSSGTSSSLS